MRCEQAQALLDRYVNRELPPVERERLESHLLECPDCRQQLVGLRGLVAVLHSVPAPPVPDGLAARVMARAHEVAGRRAPGRTAWDSVTQTVGHWWLQVDSSHIANAVAAVAAGLVLGLGLGQQSWRLAVGTREAERPVADVDAEAVYSLDYLSGVPRGSFTETYLSLTSVANDREF